MVEGLFFALRPFSSMNLSDSAHCVKFEVHEHLANQYCIVNSLNHKQLSS